MYDEDRHLHGEQRKQHESIFLSLLDSRLSAIRRFAIIKVFASAADANATKIRGILDRPAKIVL